jgi:uncharacterized paraquat-inducible protein A
VFVVLLLVRGYFFFIFGSVLMFGSNVQPKRRIKEARKEPWYCHTCDLEHPAYYSKCPKCGDHRPH